MSYSFRRHKAVEKELKHIVSEQIDKAIGEMTRRELNRHQAVHQVRKRCKKIRGALRLVRPAFESTYQFENAYFRDAARLLSDSRDAQAMIETYDLLMNTFNQQVERRTFAPIRRALSRRLTRITAEGDLDERLAEFLTRMRDARERVASWSLTASGFKPIAGGLQQTYERGCKAMLQAYDTLANEALHAWRKRVKYHWYHARLLEGIWPPVMAPYHAEVKRLSDLLGDDHNLAVFLQTLQDVMSDDGNAQTVQTMAGLVDQYRTQLQLEAKSLGERVFADRPKQLAHRWEQYWGAWRSESARPADRVAAEAALSQG